MTLLVLLAVVMVLGLSLGTVRVPLGMVWDTVHDHVLGHPMRGVADTIVWQIRAPRVVMAALVGAGLALVGVAVQALVRNPLGDPYVLGVESGAAAAAVGVIYVGRTMQLPGVATPSIAAFVGAVLTIMLVFGLARSRGQLNPVRLILVGVALSYALSGLTSLILYASPNPAAQQEVLFWLLGGFGAVTWGQIPLVLAALGIGAFVIWYYRRPLNALALGDLTAGAVGLEPDRLRTRLMLVCALVVAVVVAVVGPIGFVGLVVPHTARMIFGADHGRLIPTATLLGASYLVVMDLISRVVAAPSEMPIGIVTALVGAPFFLWIVKRQGRSLFGGMS